MKKLVTYLLLLCCVALASYAAKSDNLPIADPYVMLYKNKYYAYGTSVNGFEVYISNDLKHWKRGKRLALSPENSWGNRWFWAPEVYYVQSRKKFYMYYSVEEHICVATAASPEGPFIQEVKEPIVKDKAIDTHLFIDDDGTPYLYFVRFTNGNVIWVAEMNPDLKTIKEETLKECITADAPWERVKDRVAEGPSMLKKNGIYYLIYSANNYISPQYAVGYATSDSPFGPWKKYAGNPILRGDETSGLVGTGHGAPFVCKDGSYKYIFHAHWSKDKIHPRTSYFTDFVFAPDGTIAIKGEVIRPEVIK